MRPYGLWCQLVIFLLFSPCIVYGLCFDLPSEKVQVIGDLQWVQTAQGDTFDTLSRRYGIGYHELLEANPGIGSDQLDKGTVIVLPARFILPCTIREGIVINLAELRLYYYHKDKVYTYPVGVGRAGWDTPLGPSYVLAKLKNPTWHVPKSIQEASKKEGIILPNKVLPGEDNPLGFYALRLHYHNYLIHGTNEVEGVGRRSTAGCIRMFPEDIQELFDKVNRNTSVNIINEPYKLGWDEKENLYLEAHLPFKATEMQLPSVKKRVDQLVNRAIMNNQVLLAWDAMHNILQEMVGIPIIVGSLQKIT